MLPLFKIFRESHWIVLTWIEAGKIWVFFVVTGSIRIMIFGGEMLWDLVFCWLPPTIPVRPVSC